jgi:hypothetical protein
VPPGEENATADQQTEEQREEGGTLSGTVARTDRTLGAGSVSRLAAMAWAVRR